MKTFYFLMAMLLLSSVNVNAQFVDDMEYPNGPPYGPWWGGDLIIAGPGAGHEGEYSGYIPGDGTTDVILDLGNKILGEWGLEFYMFIPSGREAYWNLQGVLPVGAGEWIVGNIFFNEANASPGVGYIDYGPNTTGDETFFNFPHDEWFRIAMNYDLSAGMAAATWGFSVNNIIVVEEGTPFTDEDGNIPTSLGGVDFFSISFDNEYNIDTFSFINGFLELEPLAGIDDNATFEFSVYPNPSRSVIHIQSEIVIEKINIYSTQGALIKSSLTKDLIDVSHLSSGIYFIEVLSEKGKSVQKFIKI